MDVLLNESELEIYRDDFLKIIEDNKGDSQLVELLKYCYKEAHQNSMKKKMDRYVMGIKYNCSDESDKTVIDTDLPIAPIISKLIAQKFYITKSSYYNAVVNYSLIEFVSIDNCLLFLDTILQKRDKLFDRVECSENYKIKNSWRFRLCPYNLSRDDSSASTVRDYSIGICMSVLIPDDDLSLVYERLSNENKENNQTDTALVLKNEYVVDNPILFTEHECDKISSTIQEIKEVKRNNILNKILEYSNNYLQARLIGSPEDRVALSYKKKVFHINKKLIPIVKELSIADIEINDHDCVFDDVPSGYCCLSFSFYTHVVEFINIIVAGHDGDDLFKRVMNDGSLHTPLTQYNKKRWMYEVYVIDINNDIDDDIDKKKKPINQNHKKTDFFACINVQIPHKDLKTILIRLRNYNRFVSQMKKQ